MALIKKASNRPLPLRDIIDVLKRWQDDPDQFPSTPVEEASPQKPNDLMQHIVTLEKRIESLEQQVLNLTQSLQK
ncbi:hypothetical protein [Aliiglaciecola sp. NS0011-25]|uniref:hypothetical protein n=1 Tax=Aliiglaciecola sp. NS0011-25 TaxID=3127654 RepID=UPI003342CC1E